MKESHELARLRESLNHLHVGVYDKGARKQISKLASVIDSYKAMNLWERACKTRWQQQPVWIHGDFAIGNMLVEGGRLSAIIDFGGVGYGDPHAQHDDNYILSIKLRQ